MLKNKRDKTHILVMLLLFKRNFRGNFEFQKNQSVQDQGFPQDIFILPWEKILKFPASLFQQFLSKILYIYIFGD